MSVIRKSLCITFGMVLTFLGLGVTALFLIAFIKGEANITGMLVGLTLALFGWWLLRRGSKSVSEALGWLLSQFVP